MSKKSLRSYFLYITGLSEEKSTSTQLCFYCETPLSYINDSIFISCRNCKCPRCIGCGGLIVMSFSQNDSQGFLKWIIPENIFNKIFGSFGTKYQCDKCKKIPYKSFDIITVISKLWSL